MIVLADALRIALFMHGLAIFIGACIAMQRHRLIADGALYFRFLPVVHDSPLDLALEDGLPKRVNRITEHKVFSSSRF